MIALVAMLAALGLSGCEGLSDSGSQAEFGLAPDAKPNHEDQSDPDPAFRGFSWVRHRQLAGMPRPGVYESLDTDLGYLELQGIDILFSLTEVPTPAQDVEAHGMELIHVPVQDFTAPTREQLLFYLELTQAAMDAGSRVGVHCQGGRGRTGTFLAAWFVYEGRSAEQALAEIREMRPGSVETASQEQALHDLEAYLRPPEPEQPENIQG